MSEAPNKTKELTADRWNDNSNQEKYGNAYTKIITIDIELNQLQWPIRLKEVPDYTWKPMI